jgi:hypothetical protein
MYISTEAESRSIGLKWIYDSKFTHRYVNRY